jgi:hypothetical protein
MKRRADRIRVATAAVVSGEPPGELREWRQTAASRTATTSFRCVVLLLREGARSRDHRGPTLAEARAGCTRQPHPQPSGGAIRRSTSGSVAICSPTEMPLM